MKTDTPGLGSVQPASHSSEHGDGHAAVWILESFSSYFINIKSNCSLSTLEKKGKRPFPHGNLDKEYRWYIMYILVRAASAALTMNSQTGYFWLVELAPYFLSSCESINLRGFGVLWSSQQTEIEKEENVPLLLICPGLDITLLLILHWNYWSCGPTQVQGRRED